MPHFTLPEDQSELKYLYALDGRGIKLDLSRIQKFLHYLGEPQRQLVSIHVAGTNGKGSTCAMLAAALQSAGFRVGLYTSPHLLRFNERVRINGIEIDDEIIRLFLKRHRSQIDRLGLTFFEATTALALDYFATQKVDFAILETGMGGRFDATNVVEPLLSIITPIGRDHEEFLGKKVLQIAYEKAGIAKSGVPCIIARQSAAVKKFLLAAVTDKCAPPIYAPTNCRISLEKLTPQHQLIQFRLNNGTEGKIKLPLIGYHQVTNVQTALVSLATLQAQGHIQSIAYRGLEQTYWPGRLQILQQIPLVFYDAGHNAHGLQAVTQTLRQLFPPQSLTVILALGRSKRFARLGEILAPLVRRVFVTELRGYPSVPAADLANALARRIAPDKIICNPQLEKLLPQVTAELKSDDVLLITGSHYLAPTILPFFKITI